MATVSIANTTANVSGKTVVLAERDFTVTGAWTFSRSPSAPFAVTAGSGYVANLGADAAQLGGAGVVPTARLGSGAASATTFLRGDSSWAVPSTAAGDDGSTVIGIQVFS